MPAIPAYHESPDAQPLCASCAHADAPQPRTFGDMAERCGAGLLSAGLTQRKCFSYIGERAIIVMIERDAPEVKRLGWNERAGS